MNARCEPPDFSKTRREILLHRDFVVFLFVDSCFYLERENKKSIHVLATSLAFRMINKT